MSLSDILTGKRGSRYATYTRVSTEEQIEGYSLDAQLEVLTQYVQSRGGIIVKPYSDPGRSGKNDQRPEFQQMISDAEAGLIDVIAVHKLDRFSRSLLDTLMYLKRLNDCNVSFVSATEQFDFTSPIGKVVLAILSAFAEWYLDNLANEVRKGKFQRAASGYHNGTLSYGYTTPKKLQADLNALNSEFKNGTVTGEIYSHRAEVLENAIALYDGLLETMAVPDPFNSSAPVRAFQQYSYGLYSDQQIADMLNDAGYRIHVRKSQNPEGLFARDVIEDMLQNRFYIGEVSYGVRVKGKQREWMKGAHVPLISDTLFERCQRVRQERAQRYVQRPASRKREYLLSGVLQCVECGKRWGGWYTHGEPYYRDMGDKRRGQYCKAHVKSALAVDLEAQMAQFIRYLKLPKSWQKQLVQQQDAPKAKDMRVVHRKLNRQLERLQQLYTLGDIDETHYLRQRQEIHAKINNATDHDPQISQMLEMGQYLDNLEALWEESTLVEKRALVEKLFVRVYVKDGTLRAVEPTPVLWALLQEVLIRRAGRTGFLSIWRISIVTPELTREEVAELIA